MPLSLFRVTTFAATNAVTLLLYSALGCALFLLMLELQLGMGVRPGDRGAHPAPGDGADARALAADRPLEPGAWSSRGRMALGSLLAGAGFVSFLLLPPGGVVRTVVFARCGAAGARAGARGSRRSLPRCSIQHPAEPGRGSPRA
jgi:hypothetical protein